MSKIERPQRLPKESWCVPTPASTPATLLLPPCSQIQGSSRRISGFRQGHLVESLCWPRGRSGHIYCSSSSLDTCHSIEEQLLRYHWPRGQSSGHLLPRHWPRGRSGHICYLVVEHVSFNWTVVVSYHWPRGQQSGSSCLSTFRRRGIVAPGTPPAKLHRVWDAGVRV